MNFNFLNNVTIAQVEQPVKATKSGKAPIERNPTNGASMRLFKDGSIYPSAELVTKFNLEYNKEKSGNGFDVFSSSDWTQYPKDAQGVVFISATPKSNTRVDLFGQAREVDGVLSSVLTQGSKTFGETLISMLETTYGTKLFTDSKYVDLLIVEDVTMPSLDNIFYIPKPVMKGEHKGSMTTERRENAVLHPLALFSAGDIEVGKVEEPELEVVEADMVA